MFKFVNQFVYWCYQWLKFEIMAPKEPQYTETTLEKKQLDKPSKSTLGIKYPTLRDHPLHTGYLWLKGKQNDDGAEGLWRIHDNLYDLTNFIYVHPGGHTWIELTKGTDITEAFESHHITDDPLRWLPRYFVRKASAPRNYPFTFKDDGFYRTLKKKIADKLKTVPKTPETRSKFLTDLLMFSYVILTILSVYFRSFFIGVLSGVTLSLTAIAAHNFFHKKDNFRMYYFDFSMMQSKEWRISHSLSHHMYTNTINDLEISSVEPFLQYLPTKKHLIFRYASWAYSPIFYAFIFLGHFIKNVVQKAYLREFEWEILLPFIVPILSAYVTKESMWFCFGMFLWIQFMGSVHFGVVGLNAAHHHPEIFHDGDSPRQDMDWGIYQIDAVMDRKDITGSHFLVLTNFGDHALHHLFPTLDHGVLEFLYPIFLEHCKEFEIEWKLSSQLELIKGQFQQLAKDSPTKLPPGASSKLVKSESVNWSRG